MHLTRLKTAFFGSVLAAGWAVTSLVFAQYVWLDDGGRKQYSDMPPPVSVPASRILATQQKADHKDPAAVPASAAQPEAAHAKAAPTLADKNAEFLKRRSERVEREKKEAEQRRVAEEKARNCERARQHQRVLASTNPIARINKNGERVFLDSAQRAEEERDTRNVLKACE